MLSDKFGNIHIPFDFSQWNRTDARIQRFLEKSYPDKVVSRLGKTPYQRIYRRAKAHDMDMTEYLRVLGFVYDKGSTWETYQHYRDKSQVISAVKATYPDESIKDISTQPFYSSLCHFAQVEGKSIKRILVEQGLRYDDRDNLGAIWEEETIVSELLSLFPDRNVDLNCDNLWFYRAIQDAAIRAHMTVPQYLREHLHFAVCNHPVRDEDFITNQVRGYLLDAYPDGVVTQISKQTWYPKLATHCRKLNVPVREFIEDLGYEYPVDDSRITKTESELKSEILNWIQVETNLSVPLTKWPMYREIKKYSIKKLLKPKEYVKHIVDEWAST